MTTVAVIAKEAFDAVAADFSDVIKSATLTRTVQGAYDPVSGTYTTTTSMDAGRALFDTSTKVEDALGGYMAGTGELLVWIEGLDTLQPAENDSIAIGGTDYTVKHVGDIVGAGSFFAATVVKS